MPIRIGEGSEDTPSSRKYGWNYDGNDRLTIKREKDYIVDDASISSFSDWLLKQMIRTGIDSKRTAQWVGGGFKEKELWLLLDEVSNVKPSRALVERFAGIFKCPEKASEARALANKIIEPLRVIEFSGCVHEKCVPDNDFENMPFSRDTIYYRRLFSAKEKFYGRLKQLSGARISSPDMLAAATNLPIEICLGWRLPRKNELRHTTKLAIEGLDGEQLAELTLDFFAYIQPAPPRNPDEYTPSQLALHFVGNGVTIKQELLELRAHLIHRQTRRGEDEAAATAFVEKNFVGMRKPPRGLEGICATPAGIALWKQRYNKVSCKDAVPEPAADEKSIHKLAAEYGADYMTAKYEVEELHSALIADVLQEAHWILRAARGNREKAEAIATSFIDARFIGERKHSGHGRACLHLTPAGERIWADLTGRKKASDKIPVGEGEIPVYRAAKGNLNAIIRIEGLREQLIADIAAQAPWVMHTSNEDSVLEEQMFTALVEDKLIGHRVPQRGKEALYITSDGTHTWALAEEARKSLPRHKRQSKIV